MLLQQPKQPIYQTMWSFSKTMQPDTAHIKHKNSRCGFTRVPHPPTSHPHALSVNILFRMLKLYTWEVTDTTVGGKWKFLFVYNWKCKGLISTAKLDHSRKRLLVNRIRVSDCCIRKDMAAVIARSPQSLLSYLGKIT